MNFRSFVNQLNNLEKTRDFNVFANYSLNYLNDTIRYFGLDKKREKTIRISVVGTNGKGSASYFLSRFAFRSGLFNSVGLYISPHLITDHERISINGNNITEAWLDNKISSFTGDELRRLSQLSYFELFTVLALFYFSENNCDLEIYEAGLGGRLDATKLANSDYVILTKIGLDHTKILGESESKILKEKLAIAGDNLKGLYTFIQKDSLYKIIEGFCLENKIKLGIFNEPWTLQEDYLLYNKNFSFYVLDDIVVQNFNEYRKEKSTANPVSLNPELLTEIDEPPGRMEVFRKSPLLIYDIAHNPDAIEYLFLSLNNRFEFKEIDVYLASLKDKDIESILQKMIVNKKIKHIYQITDQGFNSNTVINKKISTLTLEEAKNQIISQTAPAVITGSFRLYSTFKNLLNS